VEVDFHIFVDPGQGFGVVGGESGDGAEVAAGTDPRRGCGCATAPTDDPSGLAMLLLLGIAGVLRRRRG